MPNFIWNKYNGLKAEVFSLEKDSNGFYMGRLVPVDGHDPDMAEGFCYRGFKDTEGWVDYEPVRAPDFVPNDGYLVIVMDRNGRGVRYDFVASEEAAKTLVAVNVDAIGYVSVTIDTFDMFTFNSSESPEDVQDSVRQDP